MIWVSSVSLPGQSGASLINREPPLDRASIGSPLLSIGRQGCTVTAFRSEEASPAQSSDPPAG